MTDGKINRNSFSIHSLTDSKKGSDSWIEKSPQERILAIELLRKINYGQDCTTKRLQRFFEIAELS
ncbi:MAG: hypothetical protein ACYTFY_12885 [Planctomycetota bacterium]|jgi:hypothetical protein